MAEQVILKQGQLGVPIGGPNGKIIVGQLTSYRDGTAKWTYARDTNPLVAGLGDRSTFTLSKRSDGTWTWSPTTDTSLKNLADREGFTEEQVKDSLYKTQQTQKVLNAGNATQIISTIGLTEAKKLGLPGLAGTVTDVGVRPTEVSDGTSQGQSQESDNEEGSPTYTGPQAPGTGDAAIGEDTGLTGNLKYPEDMNQNQDHILFTMIESEPRALGEGPAGPFGIGARQPPKKSLGTVILPISGPIVDSNAVGWGQDELDPLSIAGAKAFRDAALKGLTTVGSNADSAVKAIQDNAQAAKDGIVTELLATAINKSANELLSRTSGTIKNPNVELLFNGVSLRPFNFSFKMSARTQKEAIIIKKIIYFFKKGMAAKQTKSGFFLKKPYVFKIEYKHNGTLHPGMNLIKECALQNFSVNYVPDSQYASHADGNLTAYEISMQFMELDPIYFDDYDIKHDIGY